MRKLVWIGFGLLASSPLTAAAEQNELQAGLGTSVLVYTSSKTKPEGASEEAETTGVDWGIGDTVVGEIGYGVTKNLNVGGFVQLNGVSETSKPAGGGDEVDSSTFTFLLGPKLDFTFTPGDKAQPFVGGVLGYQYSSTSVGDRDVSGSAYTLMGRFGARFFPGKEFSFDPWLGLAYSTGSLEAKSDAGSAKSDVSGFSIGVYLSLSGWMD